jgi:radical SAM protein with 4Fe4S-binding SPASM domain
MKKNLLQKVIKTLKVFTTRRLVLTFDKVDFVHTNLSWRRVKNWFLAELSYFLKSDRVWVYPTHLQIEPSNVCNLRCPLCHTVTDHKPRGVLRLDDFKKLIDEVGDYLLFLHFWGWGEPFLNNDFFSMIRYAKDKGINIITSTNGHFFENKDNIDTLIDSGLDVLVFALDGADAGTYEKYRHKGDFEKVLKGLKLFLQRKKERGASFPLLNLRMMVTRDNEDQVSHMRAMAEKIGVDIFSLKTLFYFDNKDEGDRMLPCNPEYRRFKYDDKGQPVRKKNLCRKMWNHPTVYRDGSMLPCDYYTGQEFSLGNVFNENGQNFSKIWFGRDFRQLRNRFLKGKVAGLRCEDCPLNFADVDRNVSHAFPSHKKIVPIFRPDCQAQYDKNKIRPS